MNFAIHQASRIGGRRYNQDRVAYAYSNQSLLLVLADGMGGHSHGEVAAQLAMQVFTDAFVQIAQPRISAPQEFLKEAMLLAHDAIVHCAHEQQLGGNPGTTCVAALLQDGEVFWAHVGDSRLYFLRRQVTLTRTHDHSMVQQLADWGMINEDEMKTHPDRNKITNCLGGAQDAPFVESSNAMPLQRGDTVLLCSDGLWGYLSETEMATTLADSPVRGGLELLMDVASSRGDTHSDNSTVIAVRWGATELAHPTRSPIVVMLDCS